MSIAGAFVALLAFISRLYERQLTQKDELIDTLQELVKTSIDTSHTANVTTATVARRKGVRGGAD